MPRLPEPGNKLIDPIWEIQPEEHKNHYSWFMMFSTLRPHERTYQRAWDMLNTGGSREGTPASIYFKRVGRLWKWLERAAAKDFYEAQNAQTRWIERDKERRDTAYMVGEKLVKQANRVLNKIEALPDDQLKVSLSEAKDVAVAGTQLQEAAIPSMQLAVDQMQWILSSLPADKRVAVLERLRLARDGNAGLLTANSTVNNEDIDAEYNDVTGEQDDDTEEEIS